MDLVNRRRFTLAAGAALAGAALPAGRDVLALAFADEPTRPQFHFTPPRGWMNDPNGLVYVDGRYHLFFQHYPGGYTPGGRFADPLRWGPMHWGHAVSRDLVHWQHLPIALAPDTPPGGPEPIRGAAWSGSVVVDWADTSGLGLPGAGPPLVALFTQYDHADPSNQRQSLAWSADGGLTWTKYAGNPVLPNPGTRDFRDPKVFWHAPTGRWVMALAAADRIEFYASPDLKSWTRLSAFGPGQGSPGRPWECPDLFPLPVEGSPGDERWVLLVSQGKGAIYGGSGTQYFVGRFDGRVFTNDNPPETVLWLDHGRDNYAGVTFSDDPRNDRERLLIGWMSNWDYARDVPAQTFRSAMTVPRLLTLARTEEGVRLRQRPAPGLEALRRATLHESQRRRLQPGENPLAGSSAETFEIVAEFDASAGAAGAAGAAAGRAVFRLRTDGGYEETVVAYDPAAAQISVDRSRSGRAFRFPDEGKRHAAPARPENGRVACRILVDRASIEVFVNDGRSAITDTIFPAPGSRGLSLVAEGGPVLLNELYVYELGSIYG